MSRIFIVLVILLAQTISRRALAETAQGLVKILGAMPSQEVKLIPDSGIGGTKLCDSTVTTQVSKLTSYTVQVDGAWKGTSDKDPNRCFDEKTFTVTKAPSGRPPLVGTISSKNNTYVIEDGSGKTQVLEGVSSGLKDLVGKKVILDVTSYDAKPTAKIKVVSYAIYP